MVIKNKKAQFDFARKSLYWMLSGVVITITVLAFALVLSSHQRAITTVPAELKAELLSLRFLNTPECFTYEDPITGKVFPGVIDITKFVQERMDQCYRTEKDTGYVDYNFGLVLEGFSPLNENGEYQILRTNNYYNKADFTLYKDVIVRANNKNFNARMVIYVQKKI